MFQMCPQDKTEAPPPLEMIIVDDKLNFLAKEIDKSTRIFLRVQKTMTTTLNIYYGCLWNGMQAHMLEKMVPVAEHIGLTISQLEFVQQYIQYLCFMETIMWETTPENQPHLEYLLHPNIDMMVTYVNDLSKN